MIRYNNTSESFVAQFSESVSAILLFNSSMQSVVETYLDPNTIRQEWYDNIHSELSKAQRLVVDWRLSGNLYFDTQLVEKISSVSQDISVLKTQIDYLFEQLSKKYDDKQKDQLVDIFNSIIPGVSTIHNFAGAYLNDMKGWGMKVQVIHSNMNEIIAQIQSEESKLETAIKVINDEIDRMNEQIAKDRQAIADARKAEKKGIIETIFGVIFAPITGGLSLILAGIGVASIVEAEQQLSDLQNTVKNSLQKIYDEQKELADDEKLVSALKLIVSSVFFIVKDYNSVAAAIEKLQITVNTLKDEMDSVLDKIAKATNSDELIIQKVWFNASCIEWKSIGDLASTLVNADVTTNKKKISV